jgi:serine/threonine protein kinase
VQAVVMVLSVAITGFGLLAALSLALSRLTSRRAGQERAAAGMEQEAPPNRRVGPYVVERALGTGATATVYLARSSSDGRPVALKLLPREASQRARERFEREARFGAALRHPNAVELYARGESVDGACYIAMELVRGETLQALVDREGPLSAARVARLASQLCAALSHLHDRGLVHRDIKPENVMVSPGAHGAVKLIDFGLVEPVGAVREPDLIAGTPLYISPEALTRPGSVDARSDLYGLGALMYFMLCGVPVFRGRNTLEVCVQHLHDAPERPSVVLGKTVPRALEQVVLDCLAKEASARPPSAAAIAERLCALRAMRVARRSTSSGRQPVASGWRSVACRRARAWAWGLRPGAERPSALGKTSCAGARDRARPRMAFSATMRARRPSMTCIGSRAPVPGPFASGALAVILSHARQAQACRCVQG